MSGDLYGLPPALTEEQAAVLREAFPRLSLYRIGWIIGREDVYLDRPAVACPYREPELAAGYRDGVQSCYEQQENNVEAKRTISDALTEAGYRHERTQSTPGTGRRRIVRERDGAVMGQMTAEEAVDFLKNQRG
jgi:hypothetical protein